MAPSFENFGTIKNSLRGPNQEKKLCVRTEKISVNFDQVYYLFRLEPKNPDIYNFLEIK